MVGFVVVHDLANNRHVGVLNVNKAIKGEIQIYTQDNWANIEEGFSCESVFEGESEPLKLEVILDTEEVAYYDDNFKELYRVSADNALDQQDGDDVDGEV